MATASLRSGNPASTPSISGSLKREARPYNFFNDASAVLPSLPIERVRGLSPKEYDRYLQFRVALPPEEALRRAVGCP